MDDSAKTGQPESASFTERPMFTLMTRPFSRGHEDLPYDDSSMTPATEPITEPQPPETSPHMPSVAHSSSQ